MTIMVYDISVDYDITRVFQPQTWLINSNGSFILCHLNIGLWNHNGVFDIRMEYNIIVAYNITIDYDIQIYHKM